MGWLLSRDTDESLQILPNLVGIIVEIEADHIVGDRFSADRALSSATLVPERRNSTIIIQLCTTIVASKDTKYGAYKISGERADSV